MSLLFATPACRQTKKPNNFLSNWRGKRFHGIHNRHIPDIENCVDRHFKGKNLPRFRVFAEDVYSCRNFVLRRLIGYVRANENKDNTFLVSGKFPHVFDRIPHHLFTCLE